jgi:hypothetical protein
MRAASSLTIPVHSSGVYPRREIRSGSPDALKTENSLAHPVIKHNTHIIPVSRLKRVFERMRTISFWRPSVDPETDTPNHNTKADRQSTEDKFFPRL